FLYSANTLAIDPKKNYRLSGKFRTVPGTKPSTLYFGVQPFDAEGRLINPTEVHAIAGTETQLAANAAAGSYKLLVKDTAKWLARKDRRVAFDVDISGEYNDLPNRTVTSGGIEAIRQTAEGWEVTLTQPLTKGWPAGTLIRQHGESARFIYCGALNEPVPEEWQTIGHTIEREHKFGIRSARHLWRGTRYLRIILLMNFSGNNSNAALLQDIRLEEVK
ncbi:MAG: hypothetical protein J6S21_00920, partial [Victivallales bacterium]|nr:hypothetical protein [Victivallales bacterium]